MLYEVVLYPVVKGKAESEMKLYGHVQTISDTRASKLFSGKLQESINESHSVMSNSLQPHGFYSPWNFPGQNIGVGSLSLLQGIFPTQQLNPGLPHCRLIFYQLSPKESPKGHPQLRQSWPLCFHTSRLLAAGSPWKGT